MEILSHGKKYKGDRKISGNPFTLKEIPVKGAFCNREKALFESILRQLTTKQIVLLTAIAKEPSKKLYTTDDMTRHRLKSTRGVQSSLDVLTKEDLIEQREPNGFWEVVDPLFEAWLVKKAM